MKIPEAQKMYSIYHKDLINHQNELEKQRDYAKKQFEMTGDGAFSDQAATLQLSIDATSKAFEENQKVLGALAEQASLIWNEEVSKQQADAIGQIYENMGKVMTTVMRMCRGDRVPYSDEKKVMEFNDDMYKMAKNAQIIMQHIKEKIKNHDSAWGDEEEPEEYDPERKVAEAEVQGDLPEIPEIEDISLSEPEVAEE